MAGNKFSGLALWLVPTRSSLVDAIHSTMSDLRAANPGCAGEFGVHATLLAGLGDRTILPEELRDVASRAISQWQQETGVGKGGLTVGLKEVTTKGRFFQCILLALQPTAQLLSLNRVSRNLVNSHFPPPNEGEKEEYFPHISLLYATLTAQQAQQQIDEMQRKGVWNKTADGCVFKGFTEVTFDRVEVWDCTGTVEQWKRLHSIPL